MSDISGTYEMGQGSGRVLVRTGREGLAAKVGHDLTIEITRWSARVTVPDAASGGLHAAALHVELDLGSFAVREGTGGAKPLTDKDRGDIQGTAAKILGASAVATYASAKFVPEMGTIEGTLTLNGTARPLSLQVANPAPVSSAAPPRSARPTSASPRTPASSAHSSSRTTSPWSSKLRLANPARGPVKAR
jgi:hypothetical protein